MPIHTIAPLPTPVPSTDDPADFDARADATLGALPDLIDDINEAAGGIDDAVVAVAAAMAKSADIAAAAAAAIMASGFAATSSSSLSLTPGLKTIHLDQAGKTVAAGDAWVLIRRSYPDQRMYFDVTAWDGGSANMTATVDADSIAGSGGPFTDWIAMSAAFAQPGATAVDVLAGISIGLAVTPKAFWDAQQGLAVDYAPTMTLDLSAGSNFSTTIIGAPTIANPINAKVGQEIVWEWTMGAGAGQPTFGSAWITPNGVPAFDIAIGHTNIVAGKVLPSGRVFWRLGRNPV